MIRSNSNEWKSLICGVGCNILRELLRSRTNCIQACKVIYSQCLSLFSIIGREQVRREQMAAQELARRKFFIPAARTLMGAIYDCKYLMSTNLAAATDLVKVLEDVRDVPILL